MNLSLRDMNAKRRAYTLLCWALMVFAPFLLLGADSLLIHKNAFFTYPVWTDELDYWRALFSWNAVGFRTGYTGLFEEFPKYGTLGAHGFTPILLYGWFVKLFGLSYNTVMICNAVWVSLGGLAFCALEKPKPVTALFLTAFLTLYMPIVLYCVTSMTELFNYGLLLFYLAFLLRYSQKRSPWMLALCCLTIVVACLYRITYFVLFIPAVLVYSRFKPGWRMALAALLSVALAAACYFFTSAFTAPYTQGFLYHLLRADNLGAMVQMLLSHTKSNLLDCFSPTMGSPMENAFHWVYCVMTLLCLALAFVRPVRGENRHVRLKTGLDWEMLCAFLLLAAMFGIIAMLYETNDWSDFRTLSPFLWLAIAYLVIRGRYIVPAAGAAAMAVMLAMLAVLPPVAAYSEPTRFEKAEASADLSETIATYLVYDPNASNPLTNTIRMDVDTLQAMEEIHPGFGLQHGWFTTETTGKSYWILTDHLKCPVNGYERLTDMNGYKVYRLIEPYEENAHAAD